MDLIIFVVVIFTISVLAVFGTMALQTLVNSGLFDANSETFLTKGIEVYQTLDNFTVILLGGLSLGVMLSSFMTRTHPAFAVASILIWIIMIVVSAMISNFYFQIVTTSSAMATAAEALPFMLFINENWPLYVLIVGAVALILAFGKIPRPSAAMTEV